MICHRKFINLGCCDETTTRDMLKELVHKFAFSEGIHELALEVGA